MNTFISTFLGWAFFLGAVFGWTFFLAFVVQRVQIMRKEYLAKKSQRETVSDDMPVLLTTKECRGYMLNHIEDGRFYEISSLRNSETFIVCAKRYDAKAERLYCYAYLWINGKNSCNLHVTDPRDTSQSCKFLGGKSLRIDFDINPNIVVFEDENISPYLTERDYNTFVQSLQAAGFDWKIEKGKENVLGSCEYLLTETQVK